MSGISDVADVLQVDVRHIGQLVARYDPGLYFEFSVPKRTTGFRVISAPRADLKAVQRKLARLFDEIYVPRNPAHGFLRGRSIVTNAQCHVGRRHVLNVDLKSFFPSIHFRRVEGLFLSLGVPEGGAGVLTRLCTHSGSLPQGAPTSPVLSNMICFKLDRELQRLARDFDAFYTRYADDITFSRRRSKLAPEIAFMEHGRAMVGELLRGRIESNGFLVNSDKVWLYDNKHRQVVTGLVVNTKPNLDRRYIRNTRAMIYACAKRGIERAQSEHARLHRGAENVLEPDILSIIRGRLDYMTMVRGTNDPVVRKLQLRFAEIEPSYGEQIRKEMSLLKSRDFFISHASEDKLDVARPLADALIARGFSVWHDEYEIRIGDGLRQKIDEGLRNASFGILILSKHYFTKRWTRLEFEGLDTMEDVKGRRRILPVWHGVSRREVAEFSPSLAGVVARSTSEYDVAMIADEIATKARQSRER